MIETIHGAAAKNSSVSTVPSVARSPLRAPAANARPSDAANST